MGREIKFATRLNQAGYGYEEFKSIWLKAEDLGFYAATLIDLLGYGNILECWTTLAALSAVTSRIRLVPLVLSNTYRSPTLLAKMASTLDVISKGRLELGIGTGGDKSDHTAFGFPFPGTAIGARRLSEAIQILKKMWTEDEVSFKGEFYNVQKAVCSPKPLQKPRPRILVGGHGERYILRVVAEHADICNWEKDLPIDEYKRKLQVLKRYCSDVGRDFGEIELSHNCHVLIAETKIDLERKIVNLSRALRISDEEFRLQYRNSLLGTPEQCIANIERYVKLGVTYFFLIFLDSNSVDLFASQVMTAFN